MKFRVYRYDPEKDAKPYYKDYDVALEPTDRMLLDALMRLKAVDDTLSFRRSCREGVCGSDAMNINGKNGLACITNLKDVKEPVELRPLPGLPVIRDLIVDMSQFFKQYHSIKPYLVNDTPPPEKERLQSPEDREELDGLYECILCACCSTACPSFWWNPDKFVGPAGLLAAYRFIADTPRPATPKARLDNLEDPYRLFRCHTIMNCVDVCPKGLNPTQGDRQDQGHHGEAGGVTLHERDRDARGSAAHRSHDDRNAWNRIAGAAAAACWRTTSCSTRFLDAKGRAMTEDEVTMLDRLLDLTDNDLWDLIAGRARARATRRVAPLLRQLRAA